MKWNWSNKYYMNPFSSHTMQNNYKLLSRKDADKLLHPDSQGTRLLYQNFDDTCVFYHICA